LMNPLTSPLAGYNRSLDVNARKLPIIAVFTGRVTSKRHSELPVKTLIVYIYYNYGKTEAVARAMSEVLDA